MFLPFFPQLSVNQLQLKFSSKVQNSKLFVIEFLDRNDI